MDPLSISASIAGLITITNAIVTSGFKYLSEFKHSDETIKALFHEVNLLSGTLHSLQHVATRLEHEQSNLSHTTRIHHINACDNTLRKVEAQLETVAAKRNTATARTRQRVLWPLSKAETKSLFLEVERHKTSLGLALSVDEMSALLTVLASQDVMQNGITRISEELQSHRTVRDEKSLSKRRQKIIQSLKTIDYDQYQLSNVRLRQAGTGGWFLDGAEFKQWLSIVDGKLWLYGIPGAGKTILMLPPFKKHKNSSLKQGASSVGMAFFFCDYKKPETQVASTILGSLVKKLALQDERALLELEALYEIHNPKGQPSMEVTTTKLSGLLKSMASYFKHTMILIDGLDEIETNRVEILEMLCDLTSAGNLKTLFASRDEVDIRNCLSNYANISIAAQSGDLRLYVAAEIETRTTRNQLGIRDPKLKGHIMKTLITGAEGMFRWVACQMDYLCELNNDDDRRKALQELPHGLPATYERILERVKLKPNQELVKRTLRWIVCSKVPVLPDVLLAVVSIKDGDKALNHGAMTTMVDIMRWCSSLIRWKDQEMKYIELAHFTVKEFLVSIDPDEQTHLADYRIEVSKDEYDLAKICLTILNFDEFGATQPLRQTDRLPWAASTEIQEAYLYASVWWPVHASNYLEEEQIFDLAKNLFGPVKSNNFLWWTQCFAAQNSMNLEKYPELTTLHFASYLGLSKLVEWLLRQEDVDVNSASQRGTPILFAISPKYGLPRHAYTRRRSTRNKYGGVRPEYWNVSSSRETIKVLLDGGAQVNGSHGSFENDSLSWDVDLPSKDFKVSPLSMVLLRSEHTPDVVEMLLAHGARITNAVLEAGRVNLDEVCLGHTFGASLLVLLKGVTDDNIDQDARENFPRFRSEVLSRIEITSDINPDEESETSGFSPLDNTRDKVLELKTTTSNGQLDRVEKCIAILEKKSEPDTKSKAVQMALHLAARYHHTPIVEFLLRCGASIKHQDESGDTPLHQACMIESASATSGLKTVELLLQQGLDPTILNKAGISPLHIAARYQNVESVAVLTLLAKATPEPKSLLEHGILQPSPLWIAIETGCDEVAAFFLAMCDLDILRSLAWKKLSCLVPAVQRSSPAVLEMLLGKGIEINAPVGDGSLAIHHASGPDGSTTVMKFLFTKGADLSSKRMDGSTALHLVSELSSEDNIEKIKALLSAGADINSTNSRGGTVLQVAVANWSFRDDLVTFIAEQDGVDTNHKDDDGKTALMISLQHGYFTHSRILIAHGCDIKMVDDENRTALHHACGQSPSKAANQTILELVEAGLQLSEKDSKSTSAFEVALYSKDLAPQAYAAEPAFLTSPRRQRRAQKALNDNLWAPFSEIGGDFGSDSDESADDFNDDFHERNSKIYADDSTQQFWQSWNERIVMCISHMSSDQLNQRMSTGRYPIGLLVQYATSATTKSMLDKDINVNAVDTINPAIALDIAAIHGCDSDIAALLITKTSRPIDECTGSQRRNPLQLCCARPDSNMVLLRQLLKAKADPTLPDRDGATSLMIAAGQGSVDCLKVLLKHNVPINAQVFGSGSTAFHWAITASSSECVMALLKAGARVDIKGETGDSCHSVPLLWAAIRKEWDIADILIKHGAPTLEMSGGTSVIHEAASAGEQKFLRLVLDLPNRPDLNTKNKDRHTPLELAATIEDAACFELLLDNGASIETGAELHGGVAHASTHPVSNDIRKLLLHQDIRWDVTSLMNCNTVDYMNVLPLHRAAHYGNNLCIQFLKQNKFIEDINVEAEYGMTALHFAACGDQQGTVELLLQLGADAEKTEMRYRRTPLISAARYHCLRVVKTLLDHRCNTLATDANGLTAYIHALKQNKTEISAILKRHEPRANGSLVVPDLPAAPSRDVSRVDELLLPCSIQGLPNGSPDMVQLRGELSEIRRLLSKQDLAPALSQPTTTEVQTSTITRTEDQLQQKTMMPAETHREVRSIVIDQNYVLLAIVGGLTALLVWVVVLLQRMNKAMMDIEKSVPRGR
ncbi:Serine/threonine-protein phosphatase 6 regulatory ankyrin repeat subunit C [Lachnellula arida]|uniref:Serine/threonine-protein phosphatase 6 regulatory ankyrin repeat subunit C n=1 Tax=Lachnellula arida TaxID=1316785 RepID=A0A8T9BPA0_9HELO|nr:Serine/threonine-protein phosphatase 6 regulatory ankyrin repeat subunit C [Lachnellula arida]